MISNYSNFLKILDYIKENPDKQGLLAKKEFKRFNIITILIIFCIMLPLCLYTVLSITSDKPYPLGASKEITGHISLYEDTFWYTDSSQKYVFNSNDYHLDDSYEPGEIILIYLNDNNDIVSIAHQSDDYSLGIKVILMLAIPVILLMVHALVGRKTYARNWYLYVQWYDKEIAYKSKDKIEGKQYYDVTINLNDLDIDKLRLYKRYRSREIIYSLLLVGCIILTIYLCIKYDLNPYSWFILIGIIIYVIIFYILIDNCEVEMHRIKTGYYDKRC